MLAFATAAAVVAVISYWFRPSEGLGALVDANAWFGAFVGGFAFVLFSFFGTLFALWMVLKYFDWMR